jgi:hypothetical protein
MTTSLSEFIDIGSLLGVGGREEDGSPPAPPTLERTTVLLSDHLKHLSASSIGMLFRCPRQFQRRYLFGEKERPGEALVLGSSLHDTLEWNYRTKIQSHTDQPFADALQYLQDVAFPAAVEENGGADYVRWDTSIDSVRSDSERMTGAYYKTVVPRIQPVSTEQKFEIEVPGVEVPIIGFVDVQETNRVIDTKTGKSATRKVKPSWALQGRTYSFATRKPTEYHSISRAKTPTIVTGLESEDMVVPVPTDAQMQEFQRLVQGAAELLRGFIARYGTEEDWPTWGAVPDFTRNMLPCDFCGWRAGCPAWS